MMSETTNEVPTKIHPPSPEQLAIFDAIENGTGNIAVDAKAGTGKTTTCVGGLKLMPIDDYVAFAAFAKDIATEIDRRVTAAKLAGEIAAKVKVGTLHKFGTIDVYKAFPKTKLQLHGEKLKRILKECPNLRTGEIGVPENIQPFVEKAYTLSRQWGAGILPSFAFNRVEAWMELVEHFDLEDVFVNENGEAPDNVAELVKSGCNWTVYAIKYGIKIAKEMIDFEDMMYLVLFLNLKVTQYDFLIVDEAQDLNITKRMLCRRMLAVGGRAIFVGDEDQAIFGFTGADSDSMQNIIKEFSCKVLPLDVCYRCAQVIIRYVQQWVPGIKASPTAPEGLLLTMDCEDRLFDPETNLDYENDAVICRNNAPLVSLFFKCLKKNIPARIEGRDIAKQLIELVNRWKSVRSLDQLRTRLENYLEKQTAKAMAEGREDKAGLLNDKVEAILTVIENLPDDATVKTLKQKITDMFIDTKTGEHAPALTLTSSHKAKGREWYRVFWLGQNRYNPSPYARQEWHHKQEKNLMYVTGTRAKHTLVNIFVPVPPKRTTRR